MNIGPTSSDSKIEKLLDSTVSYKDIPVMKDLLVTQKKIRFLAIY